MSSVLHISGGNVHRIVYQVRIYLDSILHGSLMWRSYPASPRFALLRALGSGGTYLAPQKGFKITPRSLVTRTVSLVKAAASFI